MYYLQTRYYDPQIGQFISPDSPEYLDPKSISGLNLYVYCGNNPFLYKQLDSRLNSIVSLVKIDNKKKASLPSLNFNVALVDTDELANIPDWIYAKALYAEGALLNGLTLASIEVGVAKIGFRTPKWFGDNVDGNINPRLFFEIGVLTAEASIGLRGFSANVSLLSGEIGLVFDDWSISASIYVGYEISMNYSEGLRLSSNLGSMPVGFNVIIKIDWIALLRRFFSW